MSFKVIYRGLEVICDSVEDLDILADRATSRGVVRKPLPNVVRDPLPLHNTGSVDKHALFWSDLKDNARTLLGDLMTGKKQSDEQLRALLGLDSNMQLAGVIAGISKNLTRAGFNADKVLIRKKTFTPDKKRIYTYYLDAVFIEQMRGYVREPVA